MPVLTDITGKLTAAVDAVCQADPALLADGETIVALHRQLDRLEAATTRATGAFDAGGVWEADGARSAASWISARCHLPMPTARRRVRLGRELRHMPATEAAWLCGEIGEAHVRLLARARTPATAECFARDEEALVGHGRDLRFGQFARLVAYWRYRADPEGAEDEAQRRVDERQAHLSRSFEGCGFLDATFDPISLAIFEGEPSASKTSCSRPTGPRPESGWARASAPLTCTAPRPSAASTPWWRWRGAQRPCPEVPACPSPSSTCSWAMRPSPGPSATWPVAPP